MKASKQALSEARYLVEQINRLQAFQPEPDDFGNRRLDADETNMLALSLEQMRAKVYEEEFPALKAREIFPVESDIDPGAQTFAYEETTEVGEVKVISDDHMADDPSMVESSGSKTTHRVVMLGGGFIYTIQDLKRAAFSGKPLSARKGMALRRAYERALDRIAALGAPDDGIQYGGLNRPPGSGSGQIRETACTPAGWDATPDAATMLAEANKAVAEMISDSEETMEPDTLVLPTLQYQRFAQTMFSDGSPESAMQRFLKVNGFVKRVLSWNLLKDVYTVDNTNDSRGLLLKTDPDVCSIVIPQEFTVLSPQQQNFAFKVLAHGRTAGLCIYRPLGMRYMTSLPNA